MNLCAQLIPTKKDLFPTVSSEKLGSMTNRVINPLGGEELDGILAKANDVNDRCLYQLLRMSHQIGSQCHTILPYMQTYK